MFSTNFTKTLNSTLAVIRRDPAAMQSPAFQALTQLLVALSQEVTRISGSIQASDTEVSLSAGESSLSLKADGTIVANGGPVAIFSNGDIRIRADHNVTIKGSKVLTD